MYGVTQSQTRLKWLSSSKTIMNIFILINSANLMKWMNSSVQFSSVVQSCLTLSIPLTASTRPPCPSPVWELTQTHVRWVGDAIQSSHPLSSPSPTFNLSNIMVFSNESVLHIRWPKYWSFNFNISPSNEHSGLISFRMDWLVLLALQVTLKSLLQHHS